MGTLVANTPRRAGAPHEVVAAMYQDHISGMPITELEQKWCRTRETIYTFFREHNLDYERNYPVGFNQANMARTRAAAVRRVAAARAALNKTPDIILRVRVEHPDLPLSELARLCGMTKDAYAAKLRRLTTADSD